MKGHELNRAREDGGWGQPYDGTRAVGKAVVI